ncbi:MAG TPA: hypothetical protein VGE68_05085 [Sphingomicrobium sp.]|jgi:hypothetical protein
MRTNSEIAERLSAKRARMLPFLAVIFLAQQATYFSGAHDPVRTVAHVKIAAWLVLSVVLLAALGTGGAWFRSKEVRELLNDEATREHRRSGLVAGFWAGSIAAIVLYAIDMFEPMSARQAVHLILTASIATALVVFGNLERRAHRAA